MSHDLITQYVHPHPNMYWVFLLVPVQYTVHRVTGLCVRPFSIALPCNLHPETALTETVQLAWWSGHAIAVFSLVFPDPQLTHKTEMI